MRTSIQRRRHRGLGLFEMLVALSITAALLTATGVAFDASCKAYKINEEQSLLIQRARISINRMTTTMRSASAHAPYTSSSATSFAAGVTVTDTGVTMTDATGKTVVFRYNSVNKQLLCVTNGTSNVLARGVTSFSVKLEPMRSATSTKTGGAWDLLRRATILLSVQTGTTASASESTGKQTITLSASVMPRCNAL